MSLSYRQRFCLFLAVAVAECRIISNLGFSLNSRDDCDLYGDYCIESKGYSKDQSYSPNGRCNITILYEGICYLAPAGNHYEVEPGKDYFIVNNIKFSHFCREFVSLGSDSTKLSNGSTIYWHSDRINGYKGWRFCLIDPSDGYAIQPELSGCKCGGVGFQGSYGASCKAHGTYSNSTWCYTYKDTCPTAYRTCLLDANRYRWFICNSSDSPTRSPVAKRIMFVIGSLTFCSCFGFFLWVKSKYQALLGIASEGNLKELAYWSSKILGKSSTPIRQEIVSALDIVGPVNDYRSINLVLYDGPEKKVLNKSDEQEEFLNQFESELEALKPYLFKDTPKIVKHNVACGSFASISLALGPEESTELAVKHYTKDWDDMEDIEKRSLIDEIKIIVRLSHKNIIRCFGFVLDPKVMVVNEWCKHGSCIDAREKGVIKDLDIVMRVNILISACQGLTYLIAKEILHLDIAARNILLDEHLDAKITDFGRSHEMDDDGLYITDDPIQPLKWTAPEIVLEMKCSENSEVWAFGVTMWEILTDTEPFIGLSPIDACKGVLFENTRLPLSSIENIDLQEILRCCWMSNPQLRPSMKQIGIVLEKIIKIERSQRSISYSNGTCSSQRARLVKLE